MFSLRNNKNYPTIMRQPPSYILSGAHIKYSKYLDRSAAVNSEIQDHTAPNELADLVFINLLFSQHIMARSLDLKMTQTKMTGYR